tara:strand:+ start:104 stop:592 length:489 start_codon:yes stop_codon:yes gene_type:complete
MEEFRDIKGHEGSYQVSDLGNVKSLVRKGCLTEKILKPSNNKIAYSQVLLRKDGKTITRNIHQLVAEAFLGHTPCGYKLIVNHINFNRYDNRAENLELDTQRNNADQKHIKSSSEHVGVCLCKTSNKWLSQITINGKKKHLGRFTDEIEASKAYQKALREII